MLISLSCVIPPSSLSSLNTSVHFCGCPVPSPSPWVPSVQFLILLCVCISAFSTSSFSVAVSAKSLPVSRPPQFCLSFRLISRCLSDAHGQYLPFCGCLLPLALSSILRLPVPFSPRISFLLNVLSFHSLTFSPTISSLFLPCHPLFSFFLSSLQNSMIFFFQGCQSQFCRHVLHSGTVLNWGDRHVNVVQSHHSTHRHTLNTP